MADRVYINRQNAERIRDATVAFERQVKNAVPVGGKASAWNPCGRIARTGGGGIGAMSGSTPGTGTVTLYHYDGSTLTSAGETFTAFNISPSAVGADKYVGIMWVQSFWLVVVDGCDP